jgi:hypothetical protein
MPLDVSPLLELFDYESIQIPGMRQSAPNGGNGSSQKNLRFLSPGGDFIRHTVISRS